LAKASGVHTSVNTAFIAGKRDNSSDFIGNKEDRKTKSNVVERHHRVNGNKS